MSNITHPSPPALKESRPRADGYGFDVRALLALFGTTAGQLGTVLRGMDLPAPSESAVIRWALRDNVPPQWLAVLVVALKRRGVVVDLSELARGPK